MAARPSPRPRPVEFPQHVVTTVLVTHDGARWLPEVLAALQWQRRPPQRIVAVDAASSDESRDILVRELGAECVLGVGRNTGFGAAVAGALVAYEGAPAPAIAGRPQGEDSVEWVWLV